MPLSHFDESSGIVACDTPWGRWWQTVSEVFIEVDVPEGTKGKDVNMTMKPSFVECKLKGNVIFSGTPCRKIMADECTWVVEEKKKISIMLAKTDPPNTERIWESLLVGQYAPNPWIMNEMRKKLDLERFQIENPGFDFSGATLSKCYDNVPEVQTDDAVQTSSTHTVDNAAQSGKTEKEDESDGQSSKSASGDFVIQTDSKQKREWL